MAETASSIHHVKLVIIGSGPAGYTAAIYAARAMLEPVPDPGHPARRAAHDTTDVENYPGFATSSRAPG